MRIALATLALAIAAIGATTTDASAATPADPVFPRGLPTAANEDACFAHRCVWDARHQGNGEGHSLILTSYRGEFLVKRISHQRAHRLQSAYCARPTVTCGGYDD